jgi:peroxiredoxin
MVPVLFFSLQLLRAETVTADFSSYDEEGAIIENTLENSGKDIPNYGANIFPRIENFYAQQVSTNQYVPIDSFEGSIVILVFWAGYDRYCLKSLTILHNIAKKYRKRNVLPVLVTVDDQEAARKYFNTQQNLAFPVLIGSKRLARAYGVWGLPTIYILDRNLSIRKTFSGFTKQKIIEKEIRKLM